ncbi:hypothetical protein PCC8801_0935 [Rippkaea orientalis PCC 8801]|uniref:Uncharacterized protein n=1 Tax=Rippkaea orientalis (strain PCC 8801 / RF-1) TaxID=41431 RepID=B7JZR9_RIPO1|nr:hypothetical protein PCC8801_0935 [Rippkaea orientalis PCC 8801]
MLNRLLFVSVVLSLLVPINVYALSSNTDNRQEISPPVVFDCESDPKGDC